MAVEIQVSITVLNTATAEAVIRSQRGSTVAVVEGTPLADVFALSGQRMESLLDEARIDAGGQIEIVERGCRERGE